MKIRSTKVLSEILFECVAYGDPKDCLLRITKGGSQPTESVNDAFHPYPDAGYLWVRWFDNGWVVTGMIRRKFWPTPEKLDELMEWILEEHLVLGESPALTIELTEINAQQIQSGEEHRWDEVRNDNSDDGFFSSLRPEK